MVEADLDWVLPPKKERPEEDEEEAGLLDDCLGIVCIWLVF
jgi:hypothetical protein